MQIKSYKIGATIPTGMYANIQPFIEMEGTSLEEMGKLGMEHIKDMFGKYSDQDLKEVSIEELCKLTSFNEDGVSVDFYPKLHVYSHGGKTLESASKFVKKHSKEFNPEAVSKNCEKSWGVPAPVIAKLWKSNSGLATDFGNVVHKSLEHWINFGGVGHVIMTKAKKDINPALPKHPFLKSIIEDFNKICGEGLFLPEVFVTDIEGGRCGQIDRLLILDKEKKICRVQDYKVNIGAEDISSTNKLSTPFNELPANKLSKYQVQLSYYADILKKSGWTVEGIDVFVYEDAWKVYQLELLEI